MTIPLVDRDERTTAVENAGFRWSYLFLSFGILALVAVRGRIEDAIARELLVLVILGGVMNAAFTSFHHALTTRLALRIGVAAACALLFAAALLFFGF